MLYIINNNNRTCNRFISIFFVLLIVLMLVMGSYVQAEANAAVLLGVSATVALALLIACGIGFTNSDSILKFIDSPVFKAFQDMLATNEMLKNAVLGTKIIITQAIKDLVSTWIDTHIGTTTTTATSPISADGIFRGTASYTLPVFKDFANEPSYFRWSLEFTPLVFFSYAGCVGDFNAVIYYPPSLDDSLFIGGQNFNVQINNVQSLMPYGGSIFIHYLSETTRPNVNNSSITEYFLSYRCYVTEKTNGTILADQIIEYDITNFVLGLGTAYNGVIVVPQKPIAVGTEINVPATDTPQTILDLTPELVRGETAPIDPPITDTGSITQTWLGGILSTLTSSLTIGFDGVLTSIKNMPIPIVAPLAQILSKVTDLADTTATDASGNSLSLNFEPLKINFKSKFPFCIPFDFVNLIKPFAMQPQDFIFSIDLDTSYWSIHHNVDLSPFRLPILFFRYVVNFWFVWILISRTRDFMKW